VADKVSQKKLKLLSIYILDLYRKEKRHLSPTIQLIYLFIYLSLIRVIKLRMRWAGHLARTGEEKIHAGFRCVNLDERHNVEDLEGDGRENIKMYLLEIGWGHGLGSCGAEMGQATGCWGRGNELSVSMKYGELVDQLRNE
jgi:hypothetical protein